MDNSSIPWPAVSPELCTALPLGDSLLAIGLMLFTAFDIMLSVCARLQSKEKGILEKIKTKQVLKWSGYRPQSGDIYIVSPIEEAKRLRPLSRTY